MSALIAQQQRFAVQAARLILAAQAREIPLRLSHAWRDPRVYAIIKWAFAHGYDDGLPPPLCHPRSLHFERLALDLVAENPASHVALHDLWDTMGGAPRIEKDLGHYSVEHGGMT